MDQNRSNGEADFVSVLALNGTAHNNTENWTFPLFVVRLSLTLIPLLANLNTNILGMNEYRSRGRRASPEKKQEV